MIRTQRQPLFRIISIIWLTLEAAIAANRGKGHGPADQNMLKRGTMVLDLLIREGYFSK